MNAKTPASVTIDGRLYDKLLLALRNPSALHRERCSIIPAHGDEEHLALLAVELSAVVEDDWCEDDGDRYCGNHNAWIAYYVSNFGPTGTVLKPGSFTDDDIAFAVCQSSNRYDSALDK